jgi:hypothetical protein
MLVTGCACTPCEACGLPQKSLPGTLPRAAGKTWLRFPIGCNTQFRRFPLLYSGIALLKTIPVTASTGAFPRIPTESGRSRGKGVMLPKKRRTRLFGWLLSGARSKRLALGYPRSQDPDRRTDIPRAANAGRSAQRLAANPMTGRAPRRSAAP